MVIDLGFFFFVWVLLRFGVGAGFGFLGGVGGWEGGRGVGVLPPGR